MVCAQSLKHLLVLHVGHSGIYRILPNKVKGHFVQFGHCDFLSQKRSSSRGEAANQKQLKEVAWLRAIRFRQRNTFPRWCGKWAWRRCKHKNATRIVLGELIVACDYWFGNLSSINMASMYSSLFTLSIYCVLANLVAVSATSLDKGKECGC